MTAAIALVGEAWGEEEAKRLHPFVGVSGIELLRMLDDAGAWPLSSFDKSMIASFWRGGRDSSYTPLIWSSRKDKLFLTNVFNFRPEKNNVDTLCSSKKESGSNLPPLRLGKYLRREFTSELDRLRDELASLRPNIAIALGGTASWALLGDSRITKIRGAVAESTLVRGLKVLPTFHPAGVLRQWELRHVTCLDLAKAFREAAFPEIRRPKRTVYTDPNLADLEWFFETYLAIAERIAFDIETSGNQITCIGFSPRPDLALVVPFLDHRRSNGSYWESVEEEVSAWEFVRRVLDLPTSKVGQNGLYDIHFLWRGYGITVRNYEHDSMLLHHSIHPESPKGLGFLGSVYTGEASWKLMRAGGDTLKREDV